MENALDIINEVMDKHRFRHKRDVAEYFGVTPQALSIWIAKNQIPPKHLLKLSQENRQEVPVNINAGGVAEKPSSPEELQSVINYLMRENISLKDELRGLKEKTKNKSLKKHGSQGEHKVFLAILKVAEILFINNKTQSSPIFLIDDLFANLDVDKSKRITTFLNETKKTKKIKLQTIITTTDILKLKKNMFFNNDNNIKKHKLVNGCKA